MIKQTGNGTTIIRNQDSAEPIKMIHTMEFFFPQLARKLSRAEQMWDSDPMDRGIVVVFVVDVNARIPMRPQQRVIPLLSLALAACGIIRSPAGRECGLPAG